MYNLYNMDLAELELRWAAFEKVKQIEYGKGYEAGRQAGFAAGFAAAQGQPQAKIDAAYEQGIRDAAKLVPVRGPVRKNGVGY